MNRIRQARDITLYLLALWSFTALLVSGEFNEAVIAVCYGLTGLAFLLHRRGAGAPDLFWNGLTVIAFALTLWLARSSLFDAAIYFFMYLAIAKLFNVRKDADVRWLYLVCFFLMVGTAVLTTSVTFGLIFAIYVLSMACSLALYSVNRERERVSAAPVFAGAFPSARPEPDEAGERVALRSVLSLAVVTAFCILAGSAVLFTLIPRLSTQRLFQNYGTPPDAPPDSGFDETVQFGAFGKINLDNAVAMYVRPLDAGSDALGGHVRLRGAALDTFSGDAWRRTTVPEPSTVRQAFAPFTRRIYPYRNYTVIQPPGITNYLFGDTFPDALRVPLSVPYLFDPESNSAWFPNMLTKDIQYQVTSRVEDLDKRVAPEELEQGGPLPDHITRFVNRSVRNLSNVNRAVVSEAYLNKCLALPTTLDANRIRTLARSWIGGRSTVFEQSRAIEDRFRTQFEYTLEQKTRGNFIEDFLFRARAGHCEYFATSMALMLRSLGVPARVVNGYYCSEWNNIAKAYIVRQRDAHSWVETYLGDDYGWMTFDPTPASGVGRTVEQNVLFQRLGVLADAVKVRWYRYVIDYSFTDQTGVVRSAVRAHRAVTDILGGLDFKFGTNMPLFASAGGMAMLAVALPVIALGSVGALWLVWRWIAGRRGGSRKRKRRRETGIRFYRDLLRQLKRRGHVPAAGQTPREFARAVSAAEPDLHPLLPLTDVYYAARFNGAAPSPEHLSAASELIRQMRRNKRLRE